MSACTLSFPLDAGAASVSFADAPLCRDFWIPRRGTE